MSLEVLLQIVSVLLITVLFYKYEKPNVKFLFYGYFFFLIVLIIQIPFKFFEAYLTEVLTIDLLPQVLLAPVFIAITELTKYFSMKKFLKTRSFKNGIFFGIGWVSIQSINFFTIAFFTLILGIAGIKFDYTYLLSPDYSLFNFLFFFVLNLAISIFVIYAITKKKFVYVMIAILFSLIAYYGLLFFTGVEEIIFGIFIQAFSIFIIFFYRVLK